MLDGSPVNGDEANIGNVENNDPVPSGGKTLKQALLMKKGCRKPLPHHQKPPKNSPNIRLSDHHHNNTLLTGSSVPRPAPQSGTHGPVCNQNLHHHVKQGAKKEASSTPRPQLSSEQLRNTKLVYLMKSVSKYRNIEVLFKPLHVHRKHQNIVFITSLQLVCDKSIRSK